VEQFRVWRRCSARAEVLARLDEAGPEELLPRAVHRDARGQRVPLVDEPVSQPETIRHLVLAKWMQNFRNARVNLLGLVHEAATSMHVRRRALVRNPFAHHECRRNRELRELLFQSGQPIARGLERRRDRAIEGRKFRALFLRPICGWERQDGSELRRDLNDALRGAAGGHRQPKPAQRLTDRTSVVLETNPEPDPRRTLQWSIERE